jgi:hypothetical protein
MVLFFIDDIYIKMCYYVFFLFGKILIISEIDYEWYEFITMGKKGIN